MKKRLLIICSIIGVLLAAFQFPIYADEEPSDPPSSVPVPNSIRLDQYFYDNYDLLPYIESDGNQYIDTGIKPSSTLEFSIKYSFISITPDVMSVVFGTPYTPDNGYSHFLNVHNRAQFYLLGTYFNYPYDSHIYDLNYAYLNGTDLYFNGSRISNSISLDNISNNKNIYLFSDGSSFSSIRLFSFSLKDSSDNSYVRYYYPAKSKASGIIGLYDAVSDTFVTTAGTVPFDSPTNDNVLNFQITDFLTASLSWIGAIFEGINEMPIIWVFIAIALAGVMFRWARRIVHF